MGLDALRGSPLQGQLHTRTEAAVALLYHHCCLVTGSPQIPLRPVLGLYMYAVVSLSLGSDCVGVQVDLYLSGTVESMIVFFFLTFHPPRLLPASPKLWPRQVGTNLESTASVMYVSSTLSYQLVQRS